MRGLSLTRLPGNSGVMSLTRQNYGGPLDLGLAAAAAYSTRRLRFGYTGAAMRVRRSSDNTELDIQFNGSGELDTVALLAFVGSGNGFVTVWYDQSGNARNATRTTATQQPSIVNGGVLETENGKPTVRVIGGQFMISPLTTAQAFAPGMKMWISSVFRADTNTQQSLVSTASASSFNIHAPWEDGNTYFDIPGTSPRTFGPLLWTNLSVGSFISNSTIQQVWKNGVLSISSVSAPFADVRNSDTSVLFAYGMSPTLYFMKGCSSELIFFPNAPSATDRQTLERNQGSYYGITVA